MKNLPGLPRTVEELDQLRSECKTLVTKRAGISAGAAVVPILGLDLGADFLLLNEMMQTINRRFGLSAEQIERLDPQLKRVVLVAATSIGSEIVGKIISRQILMRVLQRIGVRVAGKSALRFIPVLGQAVAASMSFGAMKMVGDAHVDDCYAVALQTLTVSATEPSGPARKTASRTRRRTFEG